MTILVGDIGGTNTTLAVVSSADGRYAIARKERYPTASLSGIGEALDDFLGQRGGARAERCCLSGAGPVRDNKCTMTNVPWVIDGNAVGRRLSLPTYVINDFMAICYALPLIDSHDEIDAPAIPHSDGSIPRARGSVRAVVGAGTGLGTGYLVEDHGHFTAFPSEGGHADFAPYDAEMEELRRFLNAGADDPPGIEQYVSGQGIANIYRSFRASGRLGEHETYRRLDALPPAERPREISAGADTDGGLASVMDLFVRMYARYAATATLFFLPTAGLYLAGGIAAKNQRWFTDGHRFMKAFESNYNERVVPLLMATPVYLIQDYDVSLYGAAHAAVSL